MTDRVLEICKHIKNPTIDGVLVEKRLSRLCDFRIKDIIYQLEKNGEPVDIIREVIKDIMEKPDMDIRKASYYNYLVSLHGTEVAFDLTMGRKSLYESLKKEGQKVPVFIEIRDKLPMLRNGRHRLFALEYSGKEKISAIILNDELRAQMRLAFPWGTPHHIYQPIELKGYEDFACARPQSHIRAQAILDHLDDEDTIILDIGACQGFMSRYIMNNLKRKLELFLSIDIGEHNMIVAYLMFYMCKPPLAMLENCCNAQMDYGKLPSNCQFDVVLNLSVMHHYFKNHKYEEIRSEIGKAAGMAKRKMFIELHPTDDIVWSGDEKVKSIFNEEGLENFVLSSTQFKSIENIGTFWHNRPIYKLS